MDVLKKSALFAVATIAAAALIMWTLDAFGFRSPISAFLVNWLARSWVAIAGQAIQFALPSSYYDIKAFEQTGQVYERLGIRLFKRLVRCGPLAIFSPILRFPKEKTIAALRCAEGVIAACVNGWIDLGCYSRTFYPAKGAESWQK